jgi:hypothetical protein
MARSRTKTTFKILAGLMVLGVILAGALVAQYTGSIIKRGIETVGPDITGVAVTLDSVDFSWLGGKARLDGLIVGNPPGFDTSYAIKFEKCDVQLQTSSLSSNNILIDRIHITRPIITYEGSLTTSNLSTILDHVAGKGGASGDDEDAAAEEPELSAETGEKVEKKVTIRDVLLEDGELHLSLTLLGGKAAIVPLPTIHLTDIGAASGGATIAGAVGEIISALLGAIPDAISKSGGLIGKGSGKLGDSASKVLRGIGGLFENGK